MTSSRELSKACAHVPQHDLLLPCLSVEECLRYSAAMRLGSGVSLTQARMRVDEVMQVCEQGGQIVQLAYLIYILLPYKHRGVLNLDSS